MTKKKTPMKQVQDKLNQIKKDGKPGQRTGCKPKNKKPVILSEFISSENDLKFINKLFDDMAQEPVNLTDENGFRLDFEICKEDYLLRLGDPKDTSWIKVYCVGDFSLNDFKTILCQSEQLEVGKYMIDREDGRFTPELLGKKNGKFFIRDKSCSIDRKWRLLYARNSVSDDKKEVRYESELQYDVDDYKSDDRFKEESEFKPDFEILKPYTLDDIIGSSIVKIYCNSLFYKDCFCDVLKKMNFALPVGEYKIRGGFPNLSKRGIFYNCRTIDRPSKKPQHFIKYAHLEENNKTMSDSEKKFKLDFEILRKYSRGELSSRDQVLDTTIVKPHSSYFTDYDLHEVLRNTFGILDPGFYSIETDLCDCLTHDTKEGGIFYKIREVNGVLPQKQYVVKYNKHPQNEEMYWRSNQTSTAPKPQDYYDPSWLTETKEKLEKINHPALKIKVDKSVFDFITDIQDSYIKLHADTHAARVKFNFNNHQSYTNREKLVESHTDFLRKELQLTLLSKIKDEANKLLVQADINELLSEINLRPGVTIEQLISDQFTLGGLPKDWNNSLDYKSGQGPSDEYKNKVGYLGVNRSIESAYEPKLSFKVKEKIDKLHKDILDHYNKQDNNLNETIINNKINIKEQLKAIASDIGKKDIKNRTPKQIQEDTEVLKEIKNAIDSLNESSKEAGRDSSLDEILDVSKLNDSYKKSGSEILEETILMNKLNKQYEKHMKGSSAISALPAKGCFRRVDRTKK